MASAPLPMIIILTLGAAALGSPDALRALLEFTGQSPCLDIAICIFVMFMVTAYLLGAVLLVRFVRNARPGDAAGAGGGGGDQGHGAAAATDCIAQVSLLGVGVRGVSRRVRNAVGAAARLTPPSATGTWRRRFGKLTSLAGILAMAYVHSQSGSESDGWEHANSA